MAALAFKAIGYGADKIPDKIFESIPGGFFTPPDKKQTKTNRRLVREPRHKSQSEKRRSSQRHRPNFSTDFSDYSAYDDTDYEREPRKQGRRGRAKSLGHRLSRSVSRSFSRSLSRGRHKSRNTDVDGEYGRYSPMDRSDRFDPPPNADYRPYNPQDYAAPAAAATGAAMASGYDNPYVRRGSSAMPDSGYSPQVNNISRSRRATVPMTADHSTLGNWSPRMWMNRTPTSPKVVTPLGITNALSCPSPFQLSFSPSYEPPLAALLRRTTTNSPQPAGSRAPSSSAARYTPGPGYSPSPVNVNSSVPPPPPPPNTGYAPYNPADYASPYPNASYRAPGNAYPSPPPFYRQESRSQPSLTQYSHPDDQNQLIHYDPPPTQSFHDADSHHHRRRDSKHHRAKSAGHHGRSRSRVADQLRDRFDNLDTREKNLAASVGGALAGGLAGGAIGKGRLTALVGAAIGGLGARELERRHERSRTREKSPGRPRSSRHDYSRSPSRDRRRDDRYDDDASSYDSDSDRQRAARRRRESRRRRRDSDDF